MRGSELKQKAATDRNIQRATEQMKVGGMSQKEKHAQIKQDNGTKQRVLPYMSSMQD